jgi:hypothetical protein
LVPFDPVLFVRAAATRLPGAVLSPGVATGGIPCANVRVAGEGDADVAWSYAAQIALNGGDADSSAEAETAADGGFRFDEHRRIARFRKREHIRSNDVKVFHFEDVEAEDAKGAADGGGHDEIGRASEGSAADARKESLESTLVRLPSFFAAAKAKLAERLADGSPGEVDARGRKHRDRLVAAKKKNEASVADKHDAEMGASGRRLNESVAAVNASDGAARRTLLQMDFESFAEAEAQQMAQRDVKYVEAKTTAARDRAASRLKTYDYASKAEALVSVNSYGPEIGVEQLRLLRNASWYGDAWFPHAACSVSAISKSHPGYLRDLMNRRIGYAISLRGPVLLTEAGRLAMLRELDASRTVLSGFDLVRLPRGEKVTVEEIFVDPVVDNPELALEESEEEKVLEDVEKSVVGVDYAGADETLLEEERALWKAKVSKLADFVKTYVREFVGEENATGTDDATVSFGKDGTEDATDSSADDSSEVKGLKPAAK